MRAFSTQWNRAKKVDKGASTTLPARLHGRGPVPSPVVVHSYGVSDDPGGIRSSSGSAALRRAATPPRTPLLLQSSSTPTECPTTQGGFAAHPAPLRSAGLLLPPGPPSFSSRRPLLRSVRRPRGDSQLIRLRCAPPGCYSPLDPPPLWGSE